METRARCISTWGPALNVLIQLSFTTIAVCTVVHRSIVNTDLRRQFFSLVLQPVLYGMSILGTFFSPESAGDLFILSLRNDLTVQYDSVNLRLRKFPKIV